MKRLLFLLLLGVLCPALGWAQEDFITGRVVDADTKMPIPFAAVSLREEQTGALSNEYGFFQLAMPVRSLDDSLLVRALGYRTSAQLLRRGEMEDLIVELPHQAIMLANITVLGGKLKPAQFGSQARNPGTGMIQGMAGSQYATFMKNDKSKKLGQVRKVSFYIGENGFPREPFRVRLYKATGDKNAPSEDLLLDNVIVAATRGGEWFTVDLSTYNIIAPEEGFYVAMEWIASGDKFYTANFMDNYTPYGQILRPTFEFKESRTWNYTIGRGWSLITMSNGAARYNAMIKAEVDTYKTKEVREAPAAATAAVATTEPTGK